MSESLRVRLAGRDYLLRAGGDPALVQAAAQLVEQKLAAVPTAHSADTRDRQMLAMLNLAGEYLQEKRKRQALESEQGQAEQLVVSLEQLTQDEAMLVARIESALDADLL
ncbi:MAG: cell division protein ZapA [Geopsychrobacter sp.]|nr:cell division protein ZapA [Geopsychrobacter sp.]